MTPTPKLRFVERPLENFEVDQVFPQGNFSYKPRKLRVLQQWWVEPPITVNLNTGELNGSHGEWRDVPLEKEE